MRHFARGFASKGSGSRASVLEQSYRKLKPVEHVLLRPDSYVGSVEPAEGPRWLISSDGKQMQRTEAKWTPALFKVYDEILVNAADNKQRDISQTLIDVNVNAKTNTVKISNDGQTIPVAMHSGEGVYIPELVFGHLLTGSNFDDSLEKATGGRNGYGAKLCNIFSSEFKIELKDVESGLRYKQTWKDNMSEVSAPVISKLAPGETSGTSVSFKPDLKRFGLKKLDSLNMEELFRTRCYDVAACNPGLDVSYNDTVLPRSFEDYAALFKIHTMGSVFESLQEWQVGVGVTHPGAATGSHVSFVNSISTSRGGTHVDLLLDRISKGIASQLSNEVTPAHIRSHLLLFVNARLPNPAFDSQTKETLTSKPARVAKSLPPIDTLVARLLAETPIAEVALRYARAREEASLLRAVGGKKASGHRIMGIPKLEEANLAGSAKGQECTLIVTEGDSAKSLAVAGLSVVGRDIYGVYPLRGKFLNVRDAPRKQITENKEVAELKRIIGLREGTDYSKAKNRAGLRYGRIMLMCDQDIDGSHIKGLFINFLETFWPSLLKSNDFLFTFSTPLIKVSHKKDKKRVLPFFSVADYQQWLVSDKEAQNRNQWKVKYYKGLGTSTSAEAKEYFSSLDSHVTALQWNGARAQSALALAFDRTAADKRKKWLQGYNASEAFTPPIGGELSYQDFVNHELIQFSYASNVRAIPSAIDGLKTGQRKVLYACFKRPLKKEEMKVVQLAGYVAESANYHHGEVALQSTIVNMAQNFPGSNNIPLLEGVGQFGTRLQGGKDAASARYIYARMGQLTRLLFRPEDEPILQYEEEDGEVVQPVHYVPILPVVLLNGTAGIGTGWSTEIPAFNPLDVLAAVRAKLSGKKMPSLIPWYRGWEGEMASSGKGTYKTHGKIDLVKNKSREELCITELPLKRWTQDYKAVIDTLCGDKESGVRTYTEHHTEHTVDFRLQLSQVATRLWGNYSFRKKLTKSLKMESSVPVNNMHLWDSQSKIQKFATASSILSEYFPVRLKAYADRKEYMTKEMQQQCVDLQHKATFSQLVSSGEIKLLGVSKSQVEAALQDHNLPLSLLSTPLGELTEERIHLQLQKKLDKEFELETLQSLSPEQLWLNDLDELERPLQKWIKQTLV